MAEPSTQLWDPLSIDTPELVALEFPIAGIGSRFLALLLDYVVQAVALTVVLLVFVAIVSAIPSSTRAVAAQHSTMSDADAQKWAIAILVLVPFLLHWGYFTLFEAFWHGQTPGKRLIKIRVIQQTGRAIGLFESMGRNLVRVIDALPAFYLVGAICAFATRRHQRLGDMLAGTLVVHSQPIEPASSENHNRTITAAVFAPAVEAPRIPTSNLPQDALARLNGGDLLMIENFIARRLDLPLDSRAALAARLVQSIAAKLLVEKPPTVSDETWLEEVSYGYRSIAPAKPNE